MPKKVYVGNLPSRLAPGHIRSILHKLFEPCGDIDKVYVVKDRANNRPKGFAFITFMQEKGAKAALKLHGERVRGKTLNVAYAKEKGEKEAPQSLWQKIIGLFSKG